MSVLSWFLVVLRRLLHNLNTLTQIGRRALFLLISFIKRRGIDLSRTIAHWQTFNPHKHTVSTSSRQETDTGTCGFQYSAEIVRPSVVPPDRTLLQPPTFDDNYIPPHYHFRSNSESGSDADDAESQDFNPSLMVNAPTVPPVSGDLAPLSVPVPLLSEAHSLSVQHLPATSSRQHPLATQSVPPSPNLGTGYLPSTNSSVVDIYLPTPSESPQQSPHSSEVFGDVVGPSAALLNEAYPRIFPGSPQVLGRYDRKVAVPDEPTRYTIPPLTISLAPNAPPPGWKTCLHPEGAQYFFHEEKRVFTDANLFDNESFTFINHTMHLIHDFLRAHNVQLHPDVDLVLDEYLYADQSKGCRYYFINHHDRCVFWMDKAESSELFPVTEELNGISSMSHIRHELEAQYWYHCELFPRSLEVTHAIVDELRGIVLHALGDLITSPMMSTVSWKVDELNHMIRLIDGLGKSVGRNVDNRFGNSSCLVGRFMCLFVRARVYNFHGEPGARLSVDQSVYDTVRKRTRLITLLSPLLFYAPDSNLVNLHKGLNDGLIRRRGWAELITKLHEGWQEFTLYATVVLTANVAFLAIQSVDKGGNAVPDRSPTQILSYLSTSTSIGGIVVRLLLLSGAPDPKDMGASTRSPLLLEVLAIIYSLPYAMLGWSMISFSAAFSFVCFQNSSLSTRIPVAILWTIIAAFILLCILSRLAFERWDWSWLRRLSSTILSNPAVKKDDSEPNPADETPGSDRCWTWSPILTVRKLFGASDQAVV